MQKEAIVKWFDAEKGFGLLNDGSDTIIYLNTYYLEPKTKVNSGDLIKFTPYLKGNVTHALDAVNCGQSLE